MTSPFLIRGVAEVHSGPPWSWAARERLVRYMGDLGFTHYIYAPGGDPLLRERWAEPYLEDESDSFADLDGVGARYGVRLCSALDPLEPDPGAVVAKWRPLYDRGIRAFALLSRPDLAAAVLRAFPGSMVLAPEALDLPPEVEVYTRVHGPEVRAEEMRRLGRRVRRPPLVWDSYPGNDGAMANELHLRPVRGRDPLLAEESAGIIVDCCAQPEAARVALHTWSSYLRQPEEYDPERAWVQAISHVVPANAPALRLLGELTRKNCLEEEAVADEMEARFDSWLRAAAVLRDLPDKPLRDDLRPWVSKLAASAEAGLKALQAVRSRPPESDRLRGQALTALWRLRENPAWVLGDQVERYARDCLRRAQPDHH